MCVPARLAVRNAPVNNKAPTLLSVFSAAEAEPLRIEGIKPLGSYAYAIAFRDGHDTGIFSFALLQQLRERVT